MNLNLILIRHGESEANVRHEVYYEIPDHYIQLTEKGLEQAETLGKKLAKEYSNFDNNVIITSPWQRAEQTASIITKHIKPRSSYEDPLIHEISLNHSLKEMVDTRKQFFLPEKEEYSFYWYKTDTAESYHDVYKRARIFYQDILLNRYRLQENDNLFIVSHGVFISILKAVIENKTIKEILKDKSLGNCETYTTTIEI